MSFTLTSGQHHPQAGIQGEQGSHLRMLYRDLPATGMALGQADTPHIHTVVLAEYMRKNRTRMGRQANTCIRTHPTPHTRT